MDFPSLFSNLILTRWLGAKHRKLEAGRRAGVRMVLFSFILHHDFDEGEQVGGENQQDWRIQQFAHPSAHTGAATKKTGGNDTHSNHERWTK